MQPAPLRIAFAISGPMPLICLERRGEPPERLTNLRRARLISMRARSGRRRDPRRDFCPGSPQAPGECLINACAKDELIAIGALIDDFA